MKKIFVYLFIFLFSAIVFPIYAQNSDGVKSIEGVVKSVVGNGNDVYDGKKVEYQILSVEISGEDQKEQLIEIKHSAISMGLQNVQFEKYSQGDKIRIDVYTGKEGEENTYIVSGKTKKDGLILLLFIFIGVVLVVGKWWGFLSLIGLLVSFGVIFQFIIPTIIAGNNPIIIAIFGAFIIVPTTFYISHGINKKTHVGVLSTLIMLTFTGILSWLFIDMTHLTGYASEEAGFLQVTRYGTVDIRDLLLAGIIIGTLGVLDDVTVGQASVVEQIKLANKNIKMWDLFRKGMRVGQDHISSMVNTLVLVYAGSALPLLLLFFGGNKSFLDIIEFELIAEEIVRMLVGSIGLILAAPLATLMAAYFFRKD